MSTQSEGFAADFTAMGLLSRVKERVLSENTTCCERLSTHLACVGLHADVNQYVITQIVLRLEPPVAHLTLVRLLAGVEELMQPEVVGAA